MKTITKSVLCLAFGAMMLTSCSSMKHSMREPNSRVEFTKGDFSFSKQVTAEATSTKILGIDWERLFSSNSGNVDKDAAGAFDFAALPVVGPYLQDRTSGYALYKIMQDNPGYDVVFYPQYETSVNKPIGLGFIYKITTVKATTRLGKIK